MGAAVTFVTRDDGPLLTAIEKLINKQVRQETWPGFEVEVPEPAEKDAKDADARPPGVPRWATVKKRRLR